MADAATGYLLENITDAVRYNAELIGNAKEQVEGLLPDLYVFKGFIKEYTEKRTTNPTLQALANKIRNVVNKAEDAIDKFFVHKAIYKARSVAGKARHVIDHSVTIRNLAKDIESIKKEVDGIYTKNQFGFTALQQERGPADLQKPPTVEEDDVVGFDEEAKTVIERLNGKDMDLDIITIIGMPGLGKTTLARKIYNDPTIEYEFFTRAWVFVSQTFSRKEIFLSILRIFTQTTEFLHESDEFIAAELCKHLKEGKYLIVMDDVWTKEAWEDLKIAFPRNNKGSRILITSRHKQVADSATPTKGPHDLKFLPTYESWVLLEKKVFGKEKCPSELQSLGELIAARCEGLPLAIVVIAGILLNNRKSSDWWNQVAQDVGSFIVKDQEKLLALSYNHLPYHLKLCFLYLGVFPEDYEIPVWKLIRLWIAEGFVEQNGWHLSLEDIAKAWVDDLVNRNLLMIAERSSNGQIKTCRVHDILHDFCEREAQKQKLYQEIKGPNKVNLDKYRRICIHSGLEKYISLKPTGEYVRSFLCFTSDEFVLPRDHISIIPKGFELLRVLEIRSINFDIFPKDLLLLVLLRYVALSFTDKVKTVPAKISSLWNMQTLIILTRSRTLELKADMWKMYQLRHLHTKASAILPPPPSNVSPESGENVQSLSRISPESCTKQVLGRTPNIRKLGVRGRIALLFDESFNNVGELKYLTNLKLVNDVYPDPPSKSKITSLPAADKFPTNLQKLTLSETSLDWADMHILENLGKLEVLKLKDNAFKGTTWEPRNGYKSLKFLHIGRTDLENWRASKDHFPSLIRLVLHHCDRLGAVPFALADVDSFQDLELHRTSKSAAVSARRIKERKMPKGQATKTSGGFKLNIYPPDA